MTKLRIMADQIASASVSVTTVGNEIKRVIDCEVEVQRVDDRYGDYQVGGAVNPRGILARYDGRQGKELRLVVTG